MAENAFAYDTPHVYVVRPNDTLSGIALSQLGDESRWTEIARINDIGDTHQLLIGRRILLPEAPHSASPHVQAELVTSRSHPTMPLAHRPATIVPGRAFLFVIADEPHPFVRHAVRKVLLPPKGVVDMREIERLTHPERHGFTARDPASPVSMGRHVGGRVDSRYISASNRPLGSPRMEGSRFWVDLNKARRAGVTVHETETIIADLDRVIAKTSAPARQANLQRIRGLAKSVDHEILLEGAVPATAVKTASMMAITRGAQVVSGVGIVLTAYDLEEAGQRSLALHSVRPLAAESVRQVGGWGGAWAGAQIGAAGGALVGIETGPGALVTGLVGGAIGAVAGFTGASWLAKYIDQN